MAPSTSSTTPASAPFMHQISSQDAPAPPSTPHYNLSTALPAQVFVRHFVPPAAASVLQKLRANIILGKDINLAALLLPSQINNRQMVDCGDGVVFLKTSDPRLQHNLSICKFAIAFGIYQDILCQAFPDHRE